MPNVLLITADHMRYDSLACDGNPFVKTPNFDTLANSGVLFTRCYTPNPICVPARASITTGNYSHRATRNKENSGLILDGQDKIAEVFNRAGFETYAMGKLHYLPYAPPDRPKLLHGFRHAEITESGRMLKQYDPEGKLRGVEEYFDYLRDAGWGGYSRAHGIGNNDLHPAASPLPEEHYVDAWVATRTIEHLKAHVEKRKDKPFFMWMYFPKPHSPYDPPQPYDRLYDPRAISPPFGNRDMLLNRNPHMRIVAAQRGMDYLSHEAIQVMRAHFYGMVTFQDKMVGRVMAFLREAGLQEDTIVIYTCDHGDLLGDFGSCFKCNFQEGSVHVPFIMSAPGRVPAGKVSDELVGLQDILPTLAVMTGAELHYPVDGEDLSSVIAGKGGVRDVFISQCRRSPMQSYMAFDGRWKYGYCEANGVEELYDLENDPTELRNLAAEGEEKDHSGRLRREIIHWCAENGDREMLDGDDLARTEVDVDALCSFKPSAMGWRWY